MWVRFQLYMLVLFAGGCWCSRVVFNDTTLATLPPLNGLDPWSKCQGEGDAYCVVDALLVSDKPSPLLELLQEYSRNTQRNYNRTLVHRGMCVSRCGEPRPGAEPWHAAATACLDRELAKYDLQAKVLAVQYCVQPEAREPSTSARAFAGVVIVLLALVVLATAVHVLGERCANVEGNKYLLAFSLKKNWQILTYNRAKPRSDQRMKDLTSIEGIRYFAVQTVINSHVFILGYHTFSSNPEFFEKLQGSSLGQLTLNMSILIETFFSLTAFLTTYCVLITVDKSPITLWKCFISVLNRYIRLTPPSAIILWFTMTWAPRMGSGPQWAWFMEREAQDCGERWWYHILYVQNYLPMGKMCQGHTWYLAADLQLHIMGLVVLLFVLKFRKAVVPVLVLLAIGSVLSFTIPAYILEIGPLILGTTPEAIRLNFLDSKILRHLYLPAWVHIAGYVGGMTSAFLLQHIQINGIKLNQNKLFGLLFHSSLTLCVAVVAAGIVFLQMDMPLWARMIYTTLDRPLGILFFNIFLLGCVTKCKGFLSRLVEWRGFHLLGRLSFSVYLIHFTVLRVSMSSGTQLSYISIYGLLQQLISATVISYIIAIPFSLVFELPPIQLWKALTERERPRAEDRPPRPQHEAPVKPLDLVANIRRRQDV